jgi:hypothetical protein
MARLGTRRSTRCNSDKSWAPHRPRGLSRAAFHAIQRCYERRERQAAKREINEAR